MPWPRPALFLLAFVTNAFGAPPYRYDHIVVVIEENESDARVVGNRVGAPYINQLADGGVKFTQFYAITHPSLPNYLHLFSGDNQGVVDDGFPPGNPFSTPNLGAALIAAGASFAGYSEDLPAVGDAAAEYTYDLDGGVFHNRYVRKHNPWVNWQAPVGAPSIPPNGLAAETNQPFTNFPTDFSQLPTVCFVVPNEQNDMHDGTIRMADDWLRTNLGAYAKWARTHNSLLVITFDEDDFQGPNRIPTVLYGAGLMPGTVNNTTWTLHNLLRTLGDAYSATPSARGAQVRRINGVWPLDPPVLTTRFQAGVNGYADCTDTYVSAAMPDTQQAGATSLVVTQDADLSAGGNQPAQMLIRFDQLFGDDPGQVPANATIVSAKLILWTGFDFDSASGNPVAVHRMLTPWSAGATWNSLGNGVANDDVEAAATATFTHAPTLLDAPMIFDVTTDVEAWLGGATNNGWALLPTGLDTWRVDSAEFSLPERHPTLEIAYTVPVGPGYPAWRLGKFGPNAGAGSQPGDDPDGDGLANLVEYALNMNPLVASAEGGPSMEANATQHTFRFFRNMAASDVYLYVQVDGGHGPNDWTTVATRVPGIGWVISAGFTLTETGGAVEVSEPRGQSRFFRVKVTGTP